MEKEELTCSIFSGPAESKRWQKQKEEAGTGFPFSLCYYCEYCKEIQAASQDGIGSLEATHAGFLSWTLGREEKKRHLYKNLIFKMKSDKKSYLFCSCFPQKASTPLTACFCAVVCNGYPVRKSAFITKRGRDNIQQPPELGPFIFHIKISARKGEKKG